MIAYDSNQLRENNLLPPLPTAKAVNGLEAATGADLLISSLDLPIGKPALLREHIAQGACLIQLKIGFDLPSSIRDGRLKESMIRMREATPNKAQWWLLVVGIFTDKESDGALWIDGRKNTYTDVNYKAVQTARRHWLLRGGQYDHVNKISELENYLKDFERDLIAMRDHPVEDVYPLKPIIEVETDDPYQVLRRVADWRVPMSYVIGPAATETLYQACRGDGGFALEWMSSRNESNLKHLPKGLGPSHVRKFRERYGLHQSGVLRYVNTEHEERT